VSDEETRKGSGCCAVVGEGLGFAGNSVRVQQLSVVLVGCVAWSTVLLLIKHQLSYCQKWTWEETL